MALVWALGIAAQVILIVHGIEGLTEGNVTGAIQICVGSVMLLLLLFVMARTERE